MHLYLSKLEMLAFTADLHALAGCISCLFSTGPYVASYALGVCLLSRAHPIMLGLSWSLYDLCLLDRMLPCLATGSGRCCFSFAAVPERTHCSFSFGCFFITSSHKCRFYFNCIFSKPENGYKYIILFLISGDESLPQCVFRHSKCFCTSSI